MDSILWVPMLALMKERATSPLLRSAIRDNLACEAGIEGISHVELARQFVRSLGISSAPAEGAASNPIEAVSHWTRFSEPRIGGWLLVVETLVPVLFRAVRGCFASLPGADLRYLDEHVDIDANVHAQRLEEALAQVVEDPAAFPEAVQGVDFGAREVFCAPDALYTKSLWISAAPAAP